MSLLKDQTAASIVSGILAIVLAALGWDSLNATQVAKRIQERRTLETLRKGSYVSRPTGPSYYSFVPDLALRRRYRRRRTRLLTRAQIARDLTPERYAEGCAFARQWIATVGAFAVDAGVHERVALRRFLRTHHLGLIREGMIALPFIVAMRAADELDGLERRRAAWGLALVELAAFYNSVARQQRQAVYFSTVDGPFGPVVRPPRWYRRPLLAFQDRLLVDLRLRRWRWWIAERRIERLASAMP